MKEISITNESGSIFGYKTSLNREDDFGNYLARHAEEETISLIKNWLRERKINEFVLLQSLHVEREFRGKGVGSRLIQEFLSKTDVPVILISDKLESQSPGFDLESWYINFGFEPTFINVVSGPILIRF